MISRADGRALAPLAAFGRGVLLVCLGVFAVSSGCLVKHRLRISTAAPPVSLQTATLDQLLAKLRTQEPIQTLQATVRIEPSVISKLRSEVVTYHDVRAFILVRRPAFLRMIGQLPVVRTTAFDLASDGSKFELSLPAKRRFIVGSTESHKDSATGLESLRPQQLLDVLLPSGPGPEEDAVLETSSEGIGIHYIVHILRRGASGRLLLARNLWFERGGLTLDQLEVFDDQGSVVTDAHYRHYAETDGIPYPREIAMDRPLDSYGLTMSVEQLQFNQSLGDDKFQLERPEGAELVDVDSASKSAKVPSGG